jgi:hypothetical protein
MDSDRPDRRDTAATMRDTAQKLEQSEAILHDSAERSPDPATARRLHRLGDEVTRRAKDIDRRADSLPAPPHEPDQAQTAPGP